MNCLETVTVNAQAVRRLKEHYPELCIKAGLCERIAGRLYTKTYTAPPATQRQPLPAHEIVTMYEESPTSDSDMIAFARAIERKHGIGGDK